MQSSKSALSNPVVYFRFGLLLSWRSMFSDAQSLGKVVGCEKFLLHILFISVLFLSYLYPDLVPESASKVEET